MLVYVAGPYRGKTRDDVEANIQNARKVAIALWEAGHVALCPHLNTIHFNDDCACEDERYLQGDLDMLARCDAIVMTSGWERSSGAVAEFNYAGGHGIPRYVYPDLPPLHPVELRCPEQAQAFLHTTMQLYRTHLSKNADYSPANILATGEIGLVTRLWDKMARLMNLTGFRITISEAYYDAPRDPKHESIDDTLLDLACYGIIGLLLRRGQWGR